MVGNGKTRLILNPIAGHGKSKKVLAETLSVLDSHQTDYEVVESTWAGEAVGIAKDACDKGYGCVVAVGGDGTVSEVVNGMLASDAKGTAFAVIPAGTGNDFLLGNNLFSGWKDAAFALATSDELKDMDVFSFQDSAGRSVYAANSIGAGYDAYVVKQVLERGSRQMGHFGYMVEAFRGLFAFNPGKFTVTVDGEVERHEKVWLWAVTNGERFGGGMRVAPGATAFDGLMDTCALENVPRSRLPGLVFMVRAGKHIGKEGVSHRRAKELIIDAPEGFPCHTDGDTLDVTYPISVKVLPGALPLLVKARDR